MSERLPETEARDETSIGLDMLDSLALVERLASAHHRAVEAVVERQATIAAIVDAIVERMQHGGCVHYVGAGTSGRLAVLDAAEMMPTFGTPSGLICAHIAGGRRALLESVEGAEDDETAGAADMRGHVAMDDVVIGISASGGAPYVVAAMREGRDIGALTVALVNSSGSPLERLADAAIVLQTGTEPLAGSTRMKAGTAQKVALNTISTAVMVRLGRVYGNVMVDVAPTNEKLRARARRLVSLLSGTGDSQAAALLDAASGSVKVATIMAKHECDAAAARTLLDRHGGRLRDCLQ